MTEGALKNPKSKNKSCDYEGVMRFWNGSEYLFQQPHRPYLSSLFMVFYNRPKFWAYKNWITPPELTAPSPFQIIEIEKAVIIMW